MHRRTRTSVAVATILASASSLALAGCKKKLPAADVACATTFAKDAGANGAASVFYPDPQGSSGNTALSPTSLTLDAYRMEVTLANLSGRGVLEGKYVSSTNTKSCRSDDSSRVGGFGAFDEKNQFSFSHSDQRFQEAMAYYVGDRYRAYLDSVGYLYPTGSVEIVAVCSEADNAFFSQYDNAVCLGYSTRTAGAFYADDGIVTAHELQHATTTSLYAAGQSGVNLNPVWMSEGGALNEAVSDFMGLLFMEPVTHASLDPKLFGRWSLRLFDASSDGSRGAHRCPVYDSDYPRCSGFPGFSAQTNTVSYVYPDGVGWPYGRNSHGPQYARQAFVNTMFPEEIHNAGILLVGALWDAYEAVRAAGGGDAEAARAKMTRLVLEAVRALPKPSASSIAPVTFISYADALVQRSSLAGLGFTADEQQALRDALAARGLQPSGAQSVPAGWAEVGAGSQGNGLHILDNPSKLIDWTKKMLGTSIDPGFVPQGLSTGLNGSLDPGETVVVWFDIRNVSAVSAGAVQVTVTIPDSEKGLIEIHPNLNFGIQSAQKAQIVYAKIYGTQTVSALTTVDGPHSSYAVPVGNSYFLTQPYYDQTWWTGIWMRVKPGSSGQTVHFQVEAAPSNGAAQTIEFPARIN